MQLKLNLYDVHYYHSRIMDHRSRIRIIYGFSGKRLMGKTTAAIALMVYMQQRGKVVLHVEISKALKIMFARATTGIDEQRMLNDPIYKAYHRPALLDYGNDMETKHGLTYLIDNVMSIILKNTTADVVIISDIRTRDELLKIRNFGQKHNIQTHITRMNVPHWVRVRRGYIFEHDVDTGRFETELDNVTSWDEVRTTHEYERLIQGGLILCIICAIVLIWTCGM